MNWMEVALLILGVGAFAASFIIPEKKSDQNLVDPELLHNLLEKEMEHAKSRVSDVVDETLEYAVEKTERATERLSNEKIMAISDYSDTVLADINKAHQEVMFLYDMLNDKHNNLKETAKKVDQQAKQVEEKANAAAAKIAAKEEASIMLEKKIAAEQLKETAQVTSVVEKKTEKPVKAEEISANITNNIVKKDEVKKNVEVYSFVNQAPHIERPVAKQLQVENMENAVTKMREKQKEEKSNVVSKEEVAKENNNDKILRLHQLGMSSVDIAKELNLGVGEVKLVINLFKGAV